MADETSRGDENGTLSVMSHIHDKIDFTASAYIVYKDTLLLRKHDKLGIWIGVGGHIELDEDPNTAVLREIKEEVGFDVELVSTYEPKLGITTSDHLDFQELVPPEYLNIHYVNDTHQHIDFVYFARATSDDVVPEQPTDEWKWVTRDELENMKSKL